MLGLLVGCVTCDGEEPNTFSLPLVTTEAEPVVLNCDEVALVPVEVPVSGFVASESPDDVDTFATTVDIEVEETLEEEDGVEPCTKCFKLIEEAGEITEGLLAFDVMFGVSVVLFV